MTPQEARRLLGLDPEADPAPHFAELAVARERIAEMVRKAPTEALAMRFQEGLLEFDRALAVLKEWKEKEEESKLSWARAAAQGTPREKEFLRDGGVPPPAATQVLKIPEPASTPKAEAAPEEDPPELEAGAAGGGWLRAAVWLAVLAFAGGSGWWMWRKVEEKKRLLATERIVFLENYGERMIEARQWPEALAVYDEIERLRPGARVVLLGRRSIEVGMEEEQRQFVGYWSGEAEAALQAGRWDDVAAAAKKVLDRYPEEKEMRALLARAEEAKTTQARDLLEKSVKDALQNRRWDAAEATARDLLAKFPGYPAGEELLSEIREGREKEMRDRERAQKLYLAAKVRDHGAFDAEALEWLQEAVSLAPGDTEIQALYEKMASYTRTLQVPEDYPDLAKAVEAARDRDRIVVGEGVWQGPVVVDKIVQIEGAGVDRTIVEVAAEKSAAATFGPKAQGARISGLTFRQTGFDAGAERFPALLVRGGEVVAVDCRFMDASGHGVAAIEGGDFMGTRCRFENNGWDGASASGSGSRLELSDCESVGNFGHGFDLWNGAGGSINGSVARDNARNGVLVETTAEDVVVGENDLRGNREFGMVLSSAASGRVHGNRFRENLLGGLVVRFAAARVVVEGNAADKNEGPGLVYEQGLAEAKYATNRAEGNGGRQQVLKGMNFSAGE